MLKPGEYNVLKVMSFTPQGVLLDDGGDGIILPRKQVVEGTRTGDELRVFIYIDKESKPIATTETPHGVLGDIVRLEVKTITESGVFLDWGLSKDIFMHNSQMRNEAVEGEKRLVKIMLDKEGRISATENLEIFADNTELTVKENENVELTVLKQTDLGYNVLINNKHIGLLHFDDVFRHIQIGDSFTGNIKTIRPDNKIDAAEGKHGYSRVEDELEKVMRLLKENNGFLPFHDKTDPEDIYAYFGLSKKTYKKVIGNLYKNGIITIKDDGIFLN